MRIIGVLLIAFSLSACALTEPVAVIEDNGHMLKGTTTATLTGGHFSVSDGTLTCGGGYDSWDMSLTISIPVTCSDGRRGIITATRDRSGMSGSGTVVLTDGMHATFLFGSAAASF